MGPHDVVEGGMLSATKATFGTVRVNAFYMAACGYGTVKGLHDVADGRVLEGWQRL